MPDTPPSHHTAQKQPRSLLDKTFRDKSGRIVLVQMPNLPLGLWAAATLAHYFVKTDPFRTGLAVIAAISLVWWGILEVVTGVNYFRRVAGAVVLATLLFSFIMWLSHL